MDYSPPTAAPVKYAIYPRGYEQSPLADTWRFCIFVEQFPDTGRWRIHDGFDHGEVVTVNGTWTENRPQVRHLTRFDTAEEAIEVALKAVENRKHWHHLVTFLESERGQAMIEKYGTDGEKVE